MKQIIVCVAIVATLTSCEVQNVNYKRVYQVKSETGKVSTSGYIFTSQDVELSYNFWNEGGLAGFRFSNNSNKPIYIDFQRSHFIHNGYSFDYYIDEQHTASASYSESASLWWYNRYAGSATTSTSNTKSVRPSRVVEVPPHSYIYIQKFSALINDFVDCDLRNPHSGKPIKREYTKENTPIVFRNYITYSFDPLLSEPKVIDNEMWVSQLASMTTYDFKGKSSSVKRSDCSGFTEYKYPYPFASPDRFYK